METIVIISAACAAVATYGAVMLYFSRRRDIRKRNGDLMEIANGFGLEERWFNREIYQDHKHNWRSEFYEVAYRHRSDVKTVRVVP